MGTANKTVARQRIFDPEVRGINLVDREIFRTDDYRDYFRYLREHRPIYEQRSPDTGRFWNLTRYQDVVAAEGMHQVLSSSGSIVFENFEHDFPVKMFIASDPPRHTQCRAALVPLFSTQNLKGLEKLARERVSGILDDLPRSEPFDWVQRVSKELTSRMLATLLGIDQEERHQLVRWSDLITFNGFSPIEQEATRQQELMSCLDYFSALLRRRRDQSATDMVSSLCGGEIGRGMPPSEVLGNLLLLIIAGNDTTRNSISGSVLALSQYPDQWSDLVGAPELIPNMVSETIRWQTPLAYMRRTAIVDTSLEGEVIRAGDKVLLWYASANQDDTVFENPERFDLHRANARRHLAYGHGIHRCLGARLAEIQVAVLWEELLARSLKVDVLAEPVRIPSSFVRGYSEMWVRLRSAGSS